MATYTRRWLLNGNLIGTGTTVTPASAGSLVLEVTATGPQGTTVSVSAPVTVAANTTFTADQFSAPATNWRMPIVAVYDSSSTQQAALLASSTAKTFPEQSSVASPGRTVAYQINNAATRAGFIWISRTAGSTISAAESIDSTNGIDGTWSSTNVTIDPTDANTLRSQQLIRFTASNATNRWIRVIVAAGVFSMGIFMEPPVGSTWDAHLIFGASFDAGTTVHGVADRVKVFNPTADPIFFNYATGGFTQAQIDGRVALAIANHPYAKFAELPVTGNGSSTPPYDTDPESPKGNSIITNVNASISKLKAAGVRALLEPLTWRSSPSGFPANPDGTQQELGSLPYNVNVVEPIIKSQYPDQWDTAYNKPRVDLYALTYGQREMIDSDGQHWGANGYQGYRNMWDQRAETWYRWIYAGGGATWGAGEPERRVTYAELIRTTWAKQKASEIIANLPASTAKTALLNRLTALDLTNEPKRIQVSFGGSLKDLERGWNMIVVSANSTPTIALVDQHEATSGLTLAITDGFSSTTTAIISDPTDRGLIPQYVQNRAVSVSSSNSATFEVSGFNVNDTWELTLMPSSMLSGNRRVDISVNSATAVRVNTAGNTTPFVVSVPTPNGKITVVLTSPDGTANISYMILKRTYSQDLPGMTMAYTGSNPNATYPPPLSIDIPSEYQTGDVLRLYYDTGYDITLNNSVTHTLTDADASGGSISFGTTISSMTSGIHAFAIRGERGSTSFSPISVPLVHGDTTLPVLTSSATLSGAENAVMAATAVYSEPVTIVLGGADAGLLELKTSGLQSTHIVRLAGNALLNYESAKTVYSFTLTPTDRGGNVGLTTNFTFTISDQADIPTMPTFTPIASGASANTVYTSNTITIAGMGTGIVGRNGRVAANTTYSKNGAAFTNTPFTYQNGDTFALKQTTDTAVARYDATIYFDTLPVTYSVSVGVVAVTLDPATKSGLATLSNGNLTVTGAPASGVPASVRATLAKGTGKVYWEVTVSSVGGNGLLIGVCDPNQNLTDYSRPGTSSTVPGATFDARDPLYMRVNNVSKTAAEDHNGNYLGDAGAIAAGVQTFGIALDLTNKRLFYRSNRWASDQDPTSAVTGIDLSTLPITTLFPYLGPCDNTNTATINFGASSFVYAIPDGFAPYQ